MRAWLTLCVKVGERGSGPAIAPEPLSRSFDVGAAAPALVLPGGSGGLHIRVVGGLSVAVGSSQANPSGWIPTRALRRRNLDEVGFGLIRGIYSADPPAIAAWSFAQSSA